MRPARDVLPKHVFERRQRERADASNKGGRPKVDSPKRAIWLRLKG